MPSASGSKSVHLSLPLLAAFATTSVWPVDGTRAQEAAVPLREIVITADRFGIDQEKLGSASTVITRQQLQESGAVYIQDALRTVPSLAVSRNGSFGSLTVVRTRGAEANQTLVVIDGIEVNNPSGNGFDFSNLLVENIERIEVLRGPQSASWGSNALAGVINIVTRKGEPGLRGVASAEGGSFGTLQTSGGVYAGNESARLAVNATRLQTDGINISQFGNEKDGDENLTMSVKGDMDITPFFNIEGVLRRTNRDFNYDDFDDFGFVVDADRGEEREETFGRVQGTLNLFDEHWEQRVFFNTGDTEADRFTDQVRSSGNKGARRRYGYWSKMEFETPGFANAQHTLIGLVERENESYRNTGPNLTPTRAQTFRRSLLGSVVEYRLGLWDSLFLTGSYRWDDNDTFDDAETYRLTAAYVLDQTGTRFHGSLGKGVTNPTFTEQFGFNPDRFVGNPNLVPETSVGWDVGVEQKFFNDRLVVDVTYFEADLEDEIVTTFAFGPSGLIFGVENLDEPSERQGVEVSLRAQPTDSLYFVGSYTYTDSKQTRDGLEQREVRRPEHMASLEANYTFFDDRAQLGLGITYNGEMEDTDFTPTAADDNRITLDSYTLVRISGSYRLTENLQWYGRIENAFDEDYQEVFQYESPGFAAYSGLRLRLAAQ